MEEEEMGASDKSNRGGGEKEDQTAAAATVKEEEEVVVLPGFRFHPTDEELVGFYLRREVDKKPISIEIIKRIDIYKYDPWDLPKVSTAGEKEWYFFCLRERKYRNSIRPNRVTGSGFWKATGIDRPIHSPATGECIGLKKSLVYYIGSAGKGTKTDWMMHEFRLPSSPANNDDNRNTAPSMQEAEIWTICRIFKRDFTYKKYAQICSRESSSKQTPTDSNSKSSSFESDGGGAYKRFGSTSTAHQGERLATNYPEGPSKAFTDDQWNPTAKAPITTLHPEISDPIANEFYEDGNWDELGRITEHMMDPAIVYEFRYS